MNKFFLLFFLTFTKTFALDPFNTLDPVLQNAIENADTKTILKFLNNEFDINNPNLLDMFYLHGRVISPEFIEFLIMRGADITFKSKTDDHTIFDSAMRDRKSSIEEFVPLMQHNKLNLNLTGLNGWTPLRRALKFKLIDHIRLILNNLKIDKNVQITISNFLIKFNMNAEKDDFVRKLLTYLEKRNIKKLPNIRWHHFGRGNLLINIGNNKIEIKRFLENFFISYSFN